MGTIYDQHKQCSPCTKSLCTSFCLANYFCQSFVNNVSQWPNDSTHKPAETHNPQTKPLMQSEQFEQKRLTQVIHIIQIWQIRQFCGWEQRLQKRVQCVSGELNTERRHTSLLDQISGLSYVNVYFQYVLFSHILSKFHFSQPKGMLIPRYYYSCSNEPIN